MIMTHWECATAAVQAVVEAVEAFQTASATACMQLLRSRKGAKKSEGKTLKNIGLSGGNQPPTCKYGLYATSMQERNEKKKSNHHQMIKSGSNWHAGVTVAFKGHRFFGGKK